MSKLPEPTAWMVAAEMQDGTHNTFPLTGRYKDVRDTCDVGEPVPLYSESQVKELLAERDAVLKMALEALEGWKNAGTFTSRIKACSPGDEAIAAIRKVLT